MNPASLYTYTATCSGGMEALLGDEVRQFGGEKVTIGKNRVLFQGDLACGYTCCLWSRFGSRVYLQLAEFPCETEDELYSFCRAFDWTIHLSLHSTFAISCTLTKSPIHHSRFAALRVKDGLVDFFRNRYGERPSVQTRKPDLRFHVHLEERTAFLSIDFSGDSLHRRGYRVEGGSAPLKESLAAAIVQLSGFHQKTPTSMTFLDPLCGSATLLIEAALIYGDSAPGLGRHAFGFTGWLSHNTSLWEKLVDQAIAREEKGFEKPWPLLIGYDGDPVAVAGARANIARAGLDDRIHVKLAPLNLLRHPTDKGFLVTNPPYGERLLEKKEAGRLYNFLGHRLQEEFVGWNCSLFLSNPDLGEQLRIPIHSRHRLYNGPLPCLLLSGKIKGAESEPTIPWRIHSGQCDIPQGEPFFNRLRKNLKPTLKWARRNTITCFRVYDRDLPNHNLTVDLYQKWIDVREMAPPKTIDPAVAQKRFRLALGCIRDLLGVHRKQIFLHTSHYRNSQKGRGTARKTEKLLIVNEGDCRFLVNLTGSRGSGLALEQRLLFSRIRKLAQGARFLNLFCSAGAATIHAAVGGAASTTSLDPSNRSIDWCRQNLALNGFSTVFHETIKADAIQWLQKSRKTYDLIILTPPRFSKNQSNQSTFHLQRNHSQLLSLAGHRLSPEGTLLLFLSPKSFKLDQDLYRSFQINEITPQLIPLDCKRNFPHRCWSFSQQTAT